MVLGVVDEGHDFLFEVVPVADREAHALILPDCEADCAPPLSLVNCEAPPLPLAELFFLIGGEGPSSR